MATSSNVDERTLHEIYLPAFEIAVSEGKPWTVMSSYNLVNGIYASEHEELLRDILRKKWGFAGFVVSDWGGINDRVAGLKAGTNLEMPGSGRYNTNKIIQAVESGALSADQLDESATEVLAVILKAHAGHKAGVTFGRGRSPCVGPEGRQREHGAPQECRSPFAVEHKRAQANRHHRCLR